ncbi:unnamed protein product [Linum tenue]|uniref:TIR domain-containing protein n=2 Tax=Linum tenue TaxID=586396 RepID=A0AAV0GRT9_9ROSI|nr:unnamed protein product [Linum tenue]
MASSSSSPPPPPPSSHHADSSSSFSGKWEYDVFLCFRGDTRHSFTSHLSAAFRDRQVNFFIDNMLNKTESIDELTSVLKRCALSVVIFSEKFPDSSWCLDEVATISQSMTKFRHRVLPVFYRVDSSDVSGDSGSYAKTIERKYGARASKFWDRKRWMDALKVVANIAGYTSEAIKIESELVEAIVNCVQNTLLEMSPRVKPDNLIGIDFRVDEVVELLAMDTNDFRIIELWGMGGVGKTTLAKACYQRVISTVEGIKYHFVGDINQRDAMETRMEEMITKLYSTLLSESNLTYDNLLFDERKRRLSHLRVFLVFDDVENLSQIERLLLGNHLSSTHLFAPGSRIILTTRNKMVVGNVGAKIYHVDCLSHIESLQLFQLHAFGESRPSDDLMGLSSRAVSYCQGCPLAIKVVGGALIGKSRDYWVSFLSDMRQIPTPEIRHVLMRSYNALGGKEIQSLFLDIACFFYGTNKSLVTKYSPAYHLLEVLIDKSLCTCVVERTRERIQVHALLRELAWSIVNDESIKLENPTRLNNLGDIQKLLTKKSLPSLQGGSTAQGIYLDLSKASEIDVEANVFEGMTSLRFLAIIYSGNKEGAPKIHVPYDAFTTLPDSLRWLQWQKFPSKSLPSSFTPKNLVALSLEYSPILKRCWDVEPELANLVFLNLSHCINLVAIPDLSGSPKLEFLGLLGCKSLVELPSHVGDLNKLEVLDLRRCANLTILPPRLNSKFLKHFFLSQCPKVTRCPEIDSRELMILDLEQTPVRALPLAIYNIKEGGCLSLSGRHITCFPAISTSLDLLGLTFTLITEMNCYDDHQLGSLPRFSALELVANLQLKSLPKHLWSMVSRSLLIHYCPSIETLPEIFHPVTGFANIYIKGCLNLKSFPTSINNLKSLQLLGLDNTDIESLPPAIVELDQLTDLELPNNKRLKFLPCDIHKLAKLSYLNLSSCTKIKFLPELPPSLLTLCVSGCTLLQALPSNADKLRFKDLYFEDCPQLDPDLPQQVMLNFYDLAASDLHPKGVLQHSGSELPTWFDYKSSNHASDSCMMVQFTLPNCTTERRIKGIAFGLVCSLDIGEVDISVTCDCNIGNIAAAASWCSPSFGFGQDSQSDNVYIWYDKNLLGETKKGVILIREEADPWYERYAGLQGSFRFSLQPSIGQDPEKLRRIKIKSIGVSLLLSEQKNGAQGMLAVSKNKGKEVQE